MVQPWADQPFRLLPTSKVTKPTASKDAIFVSDEMANAHNMLIRGLNSIYLQAPYVKEEADIQDFLQYSLFWHDLIIKHHTAEETIFFPALEKVTGQKGIMDGNIEQHLAFHPGLDAWAEYTSDCKKGTQKFDAAQFTKLIDDFATVLITHLGDEIPTLLALDKYDIAAVKQAWRDLDTWYLSHVDEYTALPMLMGTVDWDYEGGNNFPAIPFFMPYLVAYYYGRKHKSVWRFNPNTLFGKKRPLTFLPKDE